MKLNKIFTFLLIAFPILYIYNSGILSLSVADVLLIILFPILLVDMFTRKRKIKISLYMLGLTMLIVLQLAIYSFLGLTTSDTLLTTMRIVLYYTTCSIFVKEYFDFKLGMKYLKIIAFISACFWLIQYVLLNTFDIFIPGTIPWFKTEVDTYNKIMLTHSWTSYAYSRPRAFFSEPSHFAVYEALALLVYMFDYHPNEKPKILIVLLAMFLSGSGMAMILSVIVLTFVIFKSFKSITKKKIVIMLCTVVTALALYPVYSNTSAFKTFYNRTFVEKDSTNGRFGNFLTSFVEKKENREMLFGEGIYKIADVEGQNYITSIPRVYTYFGVFGFIIFVIIVIRNFIVLKGLKKYIWILLFAISFASEILFHNLVIVYLPFIIKEFENEKI